MDSTLLRDGMMMETAGGQGMGLAGFCEGQMRRRHSVRWYADLGAGFYSREATLGASRLKARLFDAIARGVEAWRRRHAQLSRELRDTPYLLPPPKPLM